MGTDHPVMRRGIEGQEGFALEDERGWRFQACMSPVWDTAWALLALRRAGVDRDHPSMQRTVQWLLQEQISTGGDWQVRCGPVPCGGWAFEFENDIYPDIDDTAAVPLGLLPAGGRTARPGPGGPAVGGGQGTPPRELARRALRTKQTTT